MKLFFYETFSLIQQSNSFSDQSLPTMLCLVLTVFEGCPSVNGKSWRGRRFQDDVLSHCSNDLPAFCLTSMEIRFLLTRCFSASTVPSQYLIYFQLPLVDLMKRLHYCNAGISPVHYEAIILHI